jgi:phosphatidylserine/phosphatidylglycerophosphate/cardiolipin synthase-like enzyme
MNQHLTSGLPRLFVFWPSLLCALLLLGPQHAQARSPQPELAAGADVAQVLYVGFTPPAGVAQHLVKAIDQAQTEVLVQAYGFTHNAIAQALVRAHQRGAKVQVLLDEKSDATNRYVIGLLHAAGIPIRLDGAHAIAHNKVMVLDGQVVVTGSFNFTNAAETRNAENLLILRSPALAQAYRDNWLQHLQHARP